jgi:hypothetical protein
MPTFRKKPVEVEAWQFTEESKNKVYASARQLQGNVYASTDKDGNPILSIPTLEGEMVCALGDWLIVEPFPTDWRKVYPCKPDIFEKTYESTEPQSSTADKDVEQAARELPSNLWKIAEGQYRKLPFGVQGIIPLGQFVSSFCEGYKYLFNNPISGQAGQGWVSVENRLPEQGEIVLCKLSEKVYPRIGALGFFRPGEWGEEEKDNWNVTHWMPLPPPPNT